MAKEKAKLLVVDDDAIVQTIHKIYFSRFFDVSIACNGKEALQFIQETKFDVILTDINMPEVNGIELTKEIRSLSGTNQNKKAKSIIIGVTSSGDDICKEAIAAGMDTVFKKPIEISELRVFISDLLRKKKLLGKR